MWRITQRTPGWEGRNIATQPSGLAVVALCLLFGVHGSLLAQKREFGLGHNFGIGVIVGEPKGISGKVWTSNSTAFDFGLGWSLGGRMGTFDSYFNGGSRVHVHMDYLWHSFDAIPSTERFPLFYGVGARLNNGVVYNSSLAVRGVLGIAWLPRETSIDVFLAVAPSLQLTSSTGFGIDAGFGARYFF